MAFALAANIFLGTPTSISAAAQSVFYVASAGATGAGTSCADPGFVGTTDVAIQAAIDAAASGGIIHICAGTYEIGATLAVMGKTLTVEGPEIGATFLDGGGVNQIMASDSALSIRDLTFQNGYSATDGGAIYVTNTITVSGSVFMQNESSEGSGGAIYANVYADTASGSTFTNNSAAYRGGAIYATVTVTIASASAFTGNSASDGGAIAAATTVTVTGGIFTGNSAGHFGGALYASQTITTTSSSFTDNSAVAGDGGAIYALTTATISGPSSTFTNNTAGNSGGAICAGTTATISGPSSTFTNNTAGNSGGAICAGTTATISGPSSTFTNNTAGNYGGAIFTGTTVTVTTTTFIYGSAGIDGDDVLTLGGGSVCGDVQSGVYAWNDACRTETGITPPDAVWFSEPALGTRTNDLSTLSWTLRFSESVTWLIGGVSGDFSNAGTALNCVFTPTGSRSFYTITVSGCTSDGTLQPRLAADSVTDTATNSGPASTVTATAITFDGTPPTASWSGTPTSPASAGPLAWTLTFSESVSGLVAADITNAGTATCATPVISGGATVYTVTYSTCTVDGTLQPRLAADSVTDTVGNSGPPGISLGETITFDTTGRLSREITAIATPSSVTYAVPNPEVTLSLAAYDGGGAVTYTQISGDCTVSGTTATITGGTNDCVVEASIAADEVYVLDTDQVTITVSKASRSITAIATPSSVTYAVPNPEVTLSLAAYDGGGAVTYTQISGDCTVSGTTATITGGTNNCVVEASIAVDDDYAADTDQVTITVGIAEPDLTGTVTYDPNGGVCTAADQSGEDGDVISSTCTKAEYRFRGWSTTDDQTVEYRNGGEFNFYTDDGETLYAVYRLSGSPGTPTGIITYSPNSVDGTCTATTQRGTADDVINASCARSGYDFLGWTLLATSPVSYLDGAVFDFVLHNGATLYAVWNLQGTQVDAPKLVVYFSPGGAKLSAAAKEKIKLFVSELQTGGYSKIVIRGYMNPVPGVPGVGFKRAARVQRYLEKLGVTAAFVITEQLGTSPIASRNRKAVVRFILE